MEGALCARQKATGLTINQKGSSNKRSPLHHAWEGLLISQHSGAKPCREAKRCLFALLPGRSLLFKLGSPQLGRHSPHELKSCSAAWSKAVSRTTWLHQPSWNIVRELTSTPFGKPTHCARKHPHRTADPRLRSGFLLTGASQLVACWLETGGWSEKCAYPKIGHPLAVLQNSPNPLAFGFLRARDSLPILVVRLVT